MSSTIKKAIKKKYLDYKIAKQGLKDAKAKLVEYKKAAIEAKDAKKIAQIVAHTLQQKAHLQISSIIATCLKTVFGDDYDFRIDFEMKRGRTEANLVLVYNGHDVVDPLNNDSGGVADVASFALRVAALVLTKPKVRRLIVLDEPFKFLSEEYKSRMVEVLQTLSDDLAMQIIMVTHDKEYIIGKVVMV